MVTGWLPGASRLLTGPGWSLREIKWRRRKRHSGGNREHSRGRNKNSIVLFILEVENTIDEATMNEQGRLTQSRRQDFKLFGVEHKEAEQLEAEAKVERWNITN